jgi:sugar phosphate permease
MAQQHQQRTQPRISRAWPFQHAYYGWAILTAGVFSAFATVPTQGPIVGLFNQQIRDDLGWSATDISVGFVAGSLAGGVISWFIGGLLDRRGARLISAGSGVVIALAMVGLAAVQHPWQFWLLFGIARGSASSGGQLSAVVSVASWFVRKRGRAVGFMGTGQRLGQALLPLPIFLVMDLFGWRQGWLLLGGVVLLFLTIPSGVFYRRRPEDYGLLPDGATFDVSDQPEFARASDSAEVTWSLRKAKRTRTLWLLIIAQGGVVLSLNATNLHIAAHLLDNGISFGRAVTATIVFASVSALTTLPWGFVTEHVHVRYVGLASTATLAGTMIVAVFASTFAGALLFAVLYGLGVGAWTVTSRMLLANYFGRRSFGSIRGFAAPIMVTISLLGPLVAGPIRDATGSYDPAFAVFAGVFVVSFFALLFAPPPTKEPAAPEP